MATTTALVRVPGVLRTMSLALLARVPLAAIGLLLVLQVRHLGHSYALAGVCSGACALGMAVGSPILGRAIDRVGQPPVLLLAGAAVTAASVAFALLPAGAPVAAFLALAGLVGLAQPPVGACVRVIWRRMLDAADFSALVTLDATLQELAFLIGPLLLVGVAQFLGAAAALAVTGVLLGATSALFAVLPETQRLGGADPAADDAPRTFGSSALGVPGVRTLLAIAASMGVAFGATELGIITMADHLDASGMAGILFALWGAGSFAGGLAWARYAGVHEAVGTMLMLLVVLGITSAALAAVPGVWPLGAALVLAGAAVAPLFGVLYAAMGDVAPDATLTEAFSWETSAITAGIALGSAVAGAVAGAVTPRATFLVAGAAFLAGAVALRTLRATLR
ncbi:MAG TPA: MFS transporter [Baekduia sp.]|uniref:MFS transporter n=1 Tax=Baekduia sp. TaxID=2600305 RepID=UPI002CC57882|nr:MFS transporter [Baekduia sp.]HMJ36986.1 MFS transporter [Baekduia sp.]